MNPTLTLIRGLPGSGKSTLAKYLRDKHASVNIEADNYFLNDSNEYIFDKDKLHQAHKWCFGMAETLLELKHDVTVSNTFTTIKELKPYFELAKQFNIVPNVILCQGNFGSVHNVPEETLIKMKNRFVFDISKLYEQSVV